MSKSTPPFSLVGLDHIVFIVDDMAKAVSWYEDVLGAQIGYTYPQLGMEQMWVGTELIVLWDITNPGAKDAIPPVKGGRNVDHVCIALTPFKDEDMRAHLAAHGVEIERKAFHGGARGMGNSYYVRDPFGNKLELKGPAVYPDGTVSGVDVWEG